MDRRLLQRVSFSHNGEAIVAILIEDPPAGGWASEEICSACKETLGNHSFYMTTPPRFYIHGHCAAAAAFLRPNPTPSHSRPPSAQQSRRIPQNFFPSAPPTNLNSYPYDQANYPPPYYPHYNTPYYPQFPPPPPPPPYYPQFPPPPPPYYPQFPPPPPPPPYYPQFPPPYYPQFPPPPPPPSSVPIWTALVTPVVGSFLNALFSSILSNN